MTEVDSQYMENLDEWIFEEGKVVTYKYLSRAIKCHVNVAKQMLYNFVEDQKSKDGPELGIVYLVSGTVKIQDTTSSGGSATKLKVSLVPAAKLEAESKKFDQLISRHIYSLQKSSSAVSLTGVYASDREAFDAAAKQGDVGEIHSLNAHSAIKNKAAVPRPSASASQIDGAPSVAVVKQEPSSQSASNKPKISEIPTKKTDTKSSAGKIESAFSKVKAKPKGESTDSENSGASSVVTSKSGAGNGANNKSAGKKPANNAIASMFAKQPPKVKKPVVEEEKKENKELASSTSPGKENLENQQLENKKPKTDEAKGSKKSPDTGKASTGKTTAKKKKGGSQASTAKKRKRIAVASDSSEDEEDGNKSGSEEDERMSDRVEEESAPPQARIIESDDEENEIIPSTPQPDPSEVKRGRKRVKKVVDKQFLDEDGFMVTKKEVTYVSEEDDEPEPVPKKSSPKKTSPRKGAQQPAAKKAKTVAPTSTKQQGIMSFFKKV